MRDRTKSYFRKRRGRLLAAKIRSLAQDLGRAVNILDVGGRRDYWDNIGFDGVGKIKLLNIDPTDLGRATSAKDIFFDEIGDARDLSQIADLSFDLYHSNSVIEHVGGWSDMQAMANEGRRVARQGWVQTPAWEFPIEPHFRLPFMHWFATPTRAALLKYAKGYRGYDRSSRRLHAERINLLTKNDVQTLFPGCKTNVERVILAKSYIVTW